MILALVLWILGAYAVHREIEDHSEDDALPFWFYLVWPIVAALFAVADGAKAIETWRKK